jgi:MFS family permease
MGYSVYGPAILQQLAGLSALAAGYVVAIEAAAWTFSALLVAHLTGLWPGRMIRAGGICILSGVVASVFAFPAASVAAVIAAGAVLGAGFGLSYSFMSQRVLAVLVGDERGVGAAGLTTVRLTGSAAGAAMAAAIANLVGFSHGLTSEAARAAGTWVFVAALPVAALGLWSAWKLGSERLAVSDENFAAPADTKNKAFGSSA